MVNNENTGNGQILALDVGKKRIGMAISDELGLTAQGLPTLQRTRVRADIAEIDRIAGERDVEFILIGLPLNMDGTESRQSESTREFAAKITARTGRQTVLMDERETSLEAEQILRESGVGIRKRAEAVDRLAAQLILQRYLETRDQRATFDFRSEGETDPGGPHPTKRSPETETA